MLILPIKGKWFKKLLTGEKGEEYREIKPYYNSRFVNAGLLNADLTPSGKNQHVLFRNGYSAKSPCFEAVVRLDVGIGLPLWGAVPGKKCYILKMVKIMPPQNCTERLIRLFEEGGAFK